MVLYFNSSLFLLYSGSSKSEVGKKVNLIGWQLFTGSILTAPFLLQERPFERDIIFIAGALLITISTLQLFYLLKKIVSANKV